jgi:hypothetical protein
VGGTGRGVGRSDRGRAGRDRTRGGGTKVQCGCGLAARIAVRRESEVGGQGRAVREKEKAL